MRRCALILAGLAALVTAAAPAVAAKAPATMQIKVLSNRADLITDGDALVQVVLPTGVSPSSVKVDVGGRDVTSSFAVRSDGRYLGRVEDLAVGPNVLTAKLSNGHGARITITNYPKGGPTFSGEQIQPWLCTTSSNGLGPAQDAQCNAPTTYQYFYRSTDPTKTSLQPYDPANPPLDVATTTTDQGKTVPYIIRQETGTQNRGIYRIAVLFNPAQGWEPWAAQAGWNHKLFYPYGASCGTIHSQSSAQDVQNDLALSRGFMVATSSMNVLGNNCNDATSAESVLMLKERIVDRYGEIRYTMANGCSGGSIGQHMTNNAYPGLVQGIQPNCSYEDNTTTGIEVEDCHLLFNYFTLKSPQLWTVEAQKAAVAGQETFAPCELWEALFASVDDPQGGCGLPADQDYDPDTNPTGCRGDVRDFEISIYGKRPSSLWTAPEKVAGGFAGWNYDNVGVQYGRNALLSGEITPEQFVDLNEKIGGMNIDHGSQPARSVADPGTVKTAYRSGRVNDGSQLDKVAIIDLRGTSNESDIHTDFHTYAMRARLDKANGGHGNQIIWTYTPAAPIAPIPTPGIVEKSFLLLDRWLSAVEADTSSDPLKTKIVRDKPSDAVDSCFIAERQITDMNICRAAFPYFGAPRIAAGGPPSHDVLKCQLKPLARSDYASMPTPFTDDQWARLKAALPSGVCDWSKPGVDQVPSAPWTTFQAGPGGQALPPAPVSKTF
jgi:Tannase-like family of unknown function (DUF6351)